MDYLLYTLRVEGIVLLLVTSIQKNIVVYLVNCSFTLKFEFGYPTVIFCTRIQSSVPFGQQTRYHPIFSLMQRKNKQTNSGVTLPFGAPC